MLIDVQYSTRLWILSTDHEVIGKFGIPADMSNAFGLLSRLAAHKFSSASLTYVLQQHPRWEIVPYRVGWNHLTINFRGSVCFLIDTWLNNASWCRRKAHLQVVQLKQYYLCCFFLKVHKDMNMFQWNHRTTMAYHSCPGYSDVWRLCNNGFIFVMSTCRFFVTPGRGLGPLPSLCQACGGKHPNDPLLSNDGACYHPARRASECTGCKTNRILPIGTGNRYIALPKLICWEPWWLAGYCLQRTSGVSAWYVP